MNTGESLRFRLLLDLGRTALFVVDAVATKLRFPRKRGETRRREMPLSGVVVRIPCTHCILHGRFVSAHGAANASVLLFHGIGDRLHYWQKVQQRLAHTGIHSLVFHYSGYGESGGTTTLANLEQNARSAYAWLLGRTPAMPIVLLGSSLGTGLACAVVDALEPAPAGLVLAEAYTSLREAAKRVVGRPLHMVGRLMPDVWRTRGTIGHLRIPLLVIHSSSDELFPLAMAEELYATAVAGGVEAELKVFDGYSHGDTLLAAPQDYWDVVSAFVRRLAAESPEAG